MPSGHVDKSKPLRPLTAHAWAILDSLSRGPLASYTVNAGVHDRLRREGLAEERDAHPYGTSAQRKPYLFITAAGRAKLEGRADAQA